MKLTVRFDDTATGQSVELAGLREVLAAERREDVPAVLDAAEAAARGGKYAVGFVCYDAAPVFDPAFRVRVGSPGPLPYACFGVFERQLTADPIAPAPRARQLRWRPERSADSYQRAIAEVRRHLVEGWSYQVNLTTALVAYGVVDPRSVYAQLALAQATPYAAYFESESWAVASASPELFFERAGTSVTTRPMKGTARRGRFVEEDDAAAAALFASEKERAENVMIVDLLRNDLGRIANYGRVEVPELFTLEAYPTLWQLTSTVTAEIPSEHSLRALFGALFPCGSVTGAPKASTMGIIAELEVEPRGLYCGAIGWIEPGAARARFSVAIRTAVVDRATGRARYGIGGGITIDSSAEAEWSEALAKAAVLHAPAGRPGLFETFRFERSAGYVNLERHLSRIEHSARYFGVPCQPSEALVLLEVAAPGLATPARVRLSLSADGAFGLESVPLVADTEVPLRLALDEVAVDPADERLFHKTDDRHRYEEAAARHPNADDVILHNGDGELTECTRANLALRLGGRWWTPPLRCGLLPGVERARLIEEGVLAERVLYPVDLVAAEELATVSSLRGMRPARFVAAPADRGAPGMAATPGR